MKERTTLTMYVITKWSLEYRNRESPEEGIQMKLILKRRIINELLTSYLPSILLIFISYSTTFFRPFYFEASVTVNLTTMLVMTTIFISKMESLPPTSDIKMIDIWLILCQIYPFVEVVLLTAMEYQREGGNEKRKKRKKKRKSEVQIVKSISISMMDNNEKPKTKWEELAEIVSSWKAPGLKTLGRLLTSFGL